jgi:hypothetical protein
MSESTDSEKRMQKSTRGSFVSVQGQVLPTCLSLMEQYKNKKSEIPIHIAGAVIFGGCAYGKFSLVSPFSLQYFCNQTKTKVKQSYIVFLKKQYIF